MLKKIISSLIIINIILFNIIIVYADDENEEINSDDIIEVINQTTDELNLKSRIAVIYDRKSGNVIWGKNENKRSAMASTTKIMTAIVAIENSDLSQIITISRKGCWNWWI